MLTPSEPVSHILTGVTGTLGRIRLNRPKALNSLTLAMIRDIDAALTAFEADPGIAAVLITGEGERDPIRTVRSAGYSLDESLRRPEKEKAAD